MCYWTTDILIIVCHLGCTTGWILIRNVQWKIEFYIWHLKLHILGSNLVSLYTVWETICDAKSKLGCENFGSFCHNTLFCPGKTPPLPAPSPNENLVRTWATSEFHVDKIPPPPNSLRHMGGNGGVETNRCIPHDTVSLPNVHFQDRYQQNHTISSATRYMYTTQRTSCYIWVLNPTRALT